MSEQDLLLEALAAFRRVWASQYPEKGKPRRQTLDVSLLQDSWNRYIKLNVAYHGKYVATTQPEFLQQAWQQS